MLIESTFFSIIIQIITAFVDYIGLKIPVGDNYTILKEILTVELGVQIVELIFYIWLIFSIHSIKNITIYRYADWFITTPVMLITLMAFLSIKKDIPSSLTQFLSENGQEVLIIVFLNALMLGCGLAGEFMPKYNTWLVALGFIPFVMYFYKIYNDYYKKAEEEIHPVITRDRIFWYFVIIWSFYGVFALMPYKLKNTGFNILDLFSKNGFGIMLVYIIWHHRIKQD